MFELVKFSFRVSNLNAELFDTTVFSVEFVLIKFMSCRDGVAVHEECP